MQFPKVLFAATLGLLLSGCTAVTSLQPPFTDKDIVSEPSLVGTWDQDKDDCAGDNPTKAVKVETAPGSKAYRLTVPYQDPRKNWVGEYDLHLVRLKDFLFADIVFSNLTVNGEEVRDHDLPTLSTHFFARIWIEGDHLRLAAPDGGALKEAIDGHQVNFQQISDMIVFTGDTSEIQNFLLKYGDNKQIFPDSCGFTRRK